MMTATLTPTTLPTTSPSPALPVGGLIAGFRRWTVAEYENLIRHGFLTENDPLELIEGHLVLKMPSNPLHSGTIRRLQKLIERALPPGQWDPRAQDGVRLVDSVPEPDIAVVVFDPNDYRGVHPIAADTGLVVEVADSSLDIDRADKARIYARAALPIYWIVNLVEGGIEVYTDPSGPTVTPAYATRTDFHVGDSIPLVLAGVTVAQLAVRDIL